MHDACNMQRAIALWRRRRRPAPAWPSGSRRSSHWCAHACLRRHARMRTVRRLSQAIIVAVIGTVFKFDDVATATLSSCIAGAHAVAQSVPFAHMRSRRAHTSGARAHAGTNLLVASPVSLWHMSPRPAKHALKGARVRAWPAVQASRQCRAAQDHMLAAPSRVCGAWRSLCGRTTRRRARWLRTLARPSAGRDACMPFEACARRSHGRVCTGSAALRHIACCLDCRRDARAAASMLTCSRCDTYAASAGVHLPLRALLRQRRRVGNRRNRRYAHVRWWACMRACARVGALAARPVWIAMCAAPCSSLVCLCARVFAGLGVQASGVVAFACIHTLSRAYASRAHARRTPLSRSVTSSSNCTPRSRLLPEIPCRAGFHRPCPKCTAGTYFVSELKLNGVGYVPVLARERCTRRVPLELRTRARGCAIVRNRAFGQVWDRRGDRADCRRAGRPRRLSAAAALRPPARPARRLRYGWHRTLLSPRMQRTAGVRQTYGC